ncbi:hypothetical protein DFJ73DRAFT_597006, partial [Zopfochytrium polystomum]
VTSDQATTFHSALLSALQHKLGSTTFDPARPTKGSAYRSLLFVGGRVDPVVAAAAAEAGIANIESFFPVDLVLWIDPFCVSYRTGSDHTPIVYLWEDRA